MTDHDLIQDVRRDERESRGRAIWHARCLQLVDALERAVNDREAFADGIQRLQDRLNAAAARADQLEKALREIEPALTGNAYLIARAALAGVPAEPATEEKP